MLIVDSYRFPNLLNGPKISPEFFENSICRHFSLWVLLCFTREWNILLQNSRPDWLKTKPFFFFHFLWLCVNLLKKEAGKLPITHPSLDLWNSSSGDFVLMRVCYYFRKHRVLAIHRINTAVIGCYKHMYGRSEEWEMNNLIERTSRCLFQHRCFDQAHPLYCIQFLV